MQKLGLSFFFLCALMLQAVALLYLYHSYSELKVSYWEQVDLASEQVRRNKDLVAVVDILNDTLTTALSDIFGTKAKVGLAAAKLRESESTIRKYMKDAADHNQLLEQLSIGAAAVPVFATSPQPQAVAATPLPPLPSVTTSKWLTIGIPTVPRRSGVRYLQQTVDSILRQLPTQESDPMFGRVVIAIINNRPGQHPEFEEVRRSITAGPHAIYFEFREAETADPEPNNHDALSDINRPGWRVRQQTREMVGMLRSIGSLSTYYLFMEDDFEVCPHAIRALHYLLQKAADYDANWIAIRVSYGMCGFLFQSRDLPRIADYLEEHAARRPPDHLVPEFIMAETQQAQEYLQGRRNYAFRHVLLAHFGKISSVRDEESPDFPGCYTPMVSPVVFENEGFRHQECPHDDLWPCTGQPTTWKSAPQIDFTKACPDTLSKFSN